jgi:hypothetical protein
MDDPSELGNGLTVIDLNWIMLLSGTVLPFLVALVTARLAWAGLKAIVLAALAAIAGLLNELYTAAGVIADIDWSSAGANAVTTFLIAVGFHFGLWRPVNLTGVNGTLQQSVPQGVGGRHSRPDGH